MGNYKVVIEILDEKWQQTGKTIEEALSNFPFTWEQIKGKGTLTVTQGTKKHEHLMTMRLLRRIFVNKVTRAVWARNLERLLESDVKITPKKLT